jgi:hypothetical protein
MYRRVNKPKKTEGEWGTHNRRLTGPEHSSLAWVSMDFCCITVGSKFCKFLQITVAELPLCV